MERVRNPDVDLFLRSNRAPTALEATTIKSLLAKEEDSLNRLTEFMEECKRNHKSSEIAANAHKARMLNARTRRDGLVQLQESVRSGLVLVEQVTLPKLDELALRDDEEHGSHLHSKEIQGIQQKRSHITSIMQKEIEDIDKMVLRQAEIMAIAKEELQGALSVAKLCLEGLTSASTEQKRLSLSIKLKRALFHPIWRIPPEIWNHIFRYTACILDIDEDVVDWLEFQLTTILWRQQFVLSAVCHQWRVICRSDMQMWRNAVIMLESEGYSSEMDLDTHCALTGGNLDTLTIVHNDSDTAEYTPSRFSAIKTLNTLKCILPGTIDHLVDWWSVLPAITELSLRNIDDEVIPSCPLPPRFASSVKRVTYRNIEPDFAKFMPQLEELTVITDQTETFTELIPFLRHSGHNLRTLHVVDSCDSENDGQNKELKSLGKLEEISITLWDLVHFMGSNFILPSLRKISLRDCILGDEDWQPFFARNDFASTVEEIRILSIEDGDLPTIGPILGQMKTMRKLALHDESVEHILQAKIDALMDSIDTKDCWIACLDNVKTLDIVNYEEDGAIILQFVQAMRNASSAGTTRNALREVTFENCPNVVGGLRKMIQECLNG